MEKDKLREVINDQQELFRKMDNLIDREISIDEFLKGNEIVIITGIRRCGKSSLLKIISKNIKQKLFYLSFDDIKFSDFNIENFSHIEEIVAEKYGKEEVVYFLDEIQDAKSWERWVNNLYAKKIKVFVTGSNSNLLSSEISTFLTGRNKIIKLLPFSFREFLKLKKINPEYKTTSERVEVFKAFNEYFKTGGFPLIIKNIDSSGSRGTKKFFSQPPFSALVRALKNATSVSDRKSVV